MSLRDEIRRILLDHVPEPAGPIVRGRMLTAIMEAIEREFFDHGM